MAVTITDPIVASARATAADIERWYVETYDRPVPTDVHLYLTELDRLCRIVGFDTLLLAAQSVHETDAWQSPWWVQRRNPAGIGITGDPTQDAASQTWANGTDAARGHVAHMISYAGGVALTMERLDLPSNLHTYDQRWRAPIDAGYTAHNLSDLTGRWATDPQYANGIVARANEIARHVKETPAMTVYQIVGLPGPGIELPVPLAHRIIPATQTNQRPGIARVTPGYWVQHETDNHAPGADAMMHAAYLEGGAEGRQASWHFTVDDGIIVQHIPIDEVTWQAADGGGPGNMSGVSCELCVNAGIDTAKARHNAEALAGGTCKALGLPSDRVKRHWDFNAASSDRHHCPDTMMNDGYWPTFVANVAAIITPEPTLPPYATPEVPDWFARSVTQDAPSDAMVDGARWWVMRRNVESLKRVQRYSRPNTHAPKAGPPIDVRQRVRVERTFELKDEQTGKTRQWFVEPSGCFITAASFTPRVTIRSR